jgi:phosphatidylglycerol:prolipoprotein diacylglycerol transferase
MFAYWVHSLDPFAVQFGGGFGVRWYGLAYLAAFAAAFLIYRHLAQRGFSVIPADRVADFITGCAVFGVLVGGRLGYMLFYDFDGLIRNPLTLLRVWEGGMSAHGGILGVVLYTLWYAWRHGVNWPGLGDNLVVGAPLGLFFGRLANFINGELYGRPASVPWAVKFPHEVHELPLAVQREVVASAEQFSGGPMGLDQVVEAAQSSPAWREILGTYLVPRHPSQLYEAGLEGIVLFLILYVLVNYRDALRKPGLTIAAFWIGYGVFRIIVEVFFRDSDQLVLGGALTMGTVLSLLMFVFGGFFLWYSLYRKGPALLTQ